MKVAPSILSADFAILKEEMETIKNADMIHIDVMDGCFVPNLTIGPCVIKSIRKYSDMFFDVHLMINDPIKYIKDFASAGSDLITFHFEATNDVLGTIQEIKKYGKKVGISIKPKTKIEVLFPYLDMIDLVLIMSVEPGFGGQAFMEDVLSKAVELKNRKGNFVIEIDGGIDNNTVIKAKAYGIDIVVAGSYIFKQEDRYQAIEGLKCA